MLTMVSSPCEESPSREVNPSLSPTTAADRTTTTITMEIRARLILSPPKPVRKAVQMADRENMDMQVRAEAK